MDTTPSQLQVGPQARAETPTAYTPRPPPDGATWHRRNKRYSRLLGVPTVYQD